MRSSSKISQLRHGSTSTVLSLSQKKANLIPLYKTFVRPRLEFAASAWSPWNEGDIKTLERVQERFVKQIPDVRGNTYKRDLEVLASQRCKKEGKGVTQ